MGGLEAAGAMDLDCRVDHELGGFGGDQLGGGRHPGQALVVPSVMGGGGLIDHQTGRIDPDGHVGQLMGDALETGQRLTEGLAGGGMSNRHLQGGFRDPHREGSYRGPEQIEGPHGDPEPADRVRR